MIEGISVDTLIYELRQNSPNLEDMPGSPGYDTYMQVGQSREDIRDIGFLLRTRRNALEISQKMTHTIGIPDLSFMFYVDKDFHDENAELKTL